MTPLSIWQQQQRLRTNASRLPSLATYHTCTAVRTALCTRPAQHQAVVAVATEREGEREREGEPEPEPEQVLEPERVLADPDQVAARRAR